MKAGFRCQVPGVRARNRARSVIQGGLAAEKSTKMKVHPGMLMKTKKGRFQVSGARCQGARRARARRTRENWPERKARKMKVHPGMLMKTKKGRFQVPVPGVRARIGQGPVDPRRIGPREKCENEGSSGDVDENKERQVSGVRCQVSGRGSGKGSSNQRELAPEKSAKNEGSSGDVDENK